MLEDIAIIYQKAKLGLLQKETDIADPEDGTLTLGTRRNRICNILFFTT